MSTLNDTGATMDFINVFNIVANNAVTRPKDAKDATSYYDEPIDVGLDSLDMVMVIAVITDVYGIPDTAEFDDVSKYTLGTLRDYVDAHKTCEPASVDDVMEYV